MYQLIHFFFCCWIILYVYTTFYFFIRLWIAVDCFHFVASINNTAMNICLCTNLCWSASFLVLGCIPRSEIVGSCDNSMFELGGLANCLVQWQHQKSTGLSISSHSHQYSLLSVFLNIALVVYMRLYHRVWVYSSFECNDVEYLYMCLLAIRTSSLENYLFRSRVQFLTGLFIFLVLSCMSSLVIIIFNRKKIFFSLFLLDISALWDTWFSNIFSHSVNCLRFPACIRGSTEIFNCDKIRFISLFVPYAFDVASKKAFPKTNPKITLLFSPKNIYGFCLLIYSCPSTICLKVNSFKSPFNGLGTLDKTQLILAFLCKDLFTRLSVLFLIPHYLDYDAL